MHAHFGSLTLYQLCIYQMSPSIEKMDKNLKKIVHMFQKICNNVVKFGDIMPEMP